MAYTRLGEARLATGEMLTCGVVLAPDAAWAPRIRPFLAHKQPAWRAHIEAALREPLDALETRFYVGTLGSEHGPLVTCVMVAGGRGAGLLGYVFTTPEHRGKGAYSALMAHQMDDCRRAGFRILTLTTNPQSGAFRIYCRFGFEPIDATSGRMRWLASPDAEARWFALAGATALRPCPLAWDDWPALNLTALRLPAPDEPPEELPRSFGLHLMTYGTAEGTFPEVHAGWAAAWGQWPRERTRHAVTLRSPSGATVGWLLVRPDPLALGAADQVELYLHPAFTDSGGALLGRALEAVAAAGGDAVLTSYTSAPDGYRAALLRAAGFGAGGVLPGWLEHGGRRHDLHVFRRAPGSEWRQPIPSATLASPPT